MKRDLKAITKEDYMWKLHFALRVELVAEALNNEDAVGNVTKGRVVNLTDGDIRNALSGPMLSHVFATNLRALSNVEEICSTCKIMSPMRNGAVREVDTTLSASGNRVKNCVIDDIMGFMNAGKGANEKREKAVSFSWGIQSKGPAPSTVLHSRVDPTEKNAKPKQKDDTTSDANTNKDQNTQMLFHGTLRSSEYALGTQMNLSRIGFDDERQKYITEDNELIKHRIKKALIAFRNTILDIHGAKCSSNMPHLIKVTGIVTEKTNAIDLMTKYSALNDDFISIHKDLSEVSYEFQDVTEFNKVMETLLDDEYLDFMIERNMNFINSQFAETSK